MLLLQSVYDTLVYNHICSHVLVDKDGEVYDAYVYQDRNCLKDFVCTFLNEPDCLLYHNTSFHRCNHNLEDHDDMARDDYMALDDDMVRDDDEGLDPN